MFYICLDAWMTADSNKDKDTDKLDWLTDEDNHLKSSWDIVSREEEFQLLLNKLLELHEVYDMRPSQRGKKPEILSDISNFKEVIKFIYQVRCNLFHGGKNPNIERDKELVKYSGLILEKWVEYATKEAQY